ncbi:hypothetical protein CLM85_06155 [Streptomyces albidoflavus]|nr:hypothetical protein CLM83_17360 [Streptomyces albidoflavus]PBO25143.1 hypothetical protein CLM85_06155 [Streptomyces albidoflavus]PBO28014.1 hypothetical protein CLM84_22275 [Streptomyces albidoflavus]
MSERPSWPWQRLSSPWLPEPATAVRSPHGPERLRRLTADPLRLMRLFGITEKTAMHSVTAAHPERTAKLPR